MKWHLSILALALSGCGSTGIIPMDKGTYMVANTAAGRGFSTGDGPKADVYLQANEFCAKTNQQVETLNITSQDGKPFVRSGHAELQFRCVNGSEKK
jgi:hypothetical protein